MHTKNLRYSWDHASGYEPVRGSSPGPMRQQGADVEVRREARMVFQRAEFQIRRSCSRGLGTHLCHFFT